jgi:hypothetical protein
MIVKRSLAILVIALASGALWASCSLPVGVVIPERSPTKKTAPIVATSQFAPSAVSDCEPFGAAESVIVNGGFEKGDIGRTVNSSGTGSTWQEHSLIGTGTSFSPYSGVGAARLGGYEGSSDRLEQQVFIALGAKLQYWWKIAQPRPVSQLTVSLVQLDGSNSAILVVHRDEESDERWQQDCVDLSAYSGQEYILEFYVHNDNYTTTAFYIDEVFLSKEQGSQ